MTIGYTSAQQQAVETIEHNLQIIAGAGAGKTRVVAGRVVHILRQEGSSPENVVVLTFARKAAAEVKDRIGRLYEAELGHRRGLAGLSVGTFHVFCMELLQSHVPGWLQVDILNEVKQRLFIDKYSRQSGMAELGLRRWIDSGRYATILRILRESRLNREVLEGHPVMQALKAYQALLRQHKYVDYDEIIYRTVIELKTNETMRQKVRDRVRHVIVDEYQDVSPVQEELIRVLHDLGASICVVGDPRQTIYQWRGSDPEIINGFNARYPDVRQVDLAVNYRSSPAITTVARRVVDRNTRQTSPGMSSAGRQVFERGDLLCLQFGDLESEGDWIARRILHLRGLPYRDGGADSAARGLSWSDCAILLRSVRHCAAPITAALRAHNIPYVVSGTSGLFDAPEAQAATAIFLFLAGSVDAEAVRERWRAADIGLSASALDTGIALLKQRRDDAARAADAYDDYHAKQEAGAAAANSEVQDSTSVMERTVGQAHLAHFGLHDLQAVFQAFLTATGLREELVPDGRGAVVYYNLGKFSQVISDYLSIHYLTPAKRQYARFARFLECQAPDAYPEGGHDNAYATPDAVRIMTVHASKGMEFPAVFLPCLQANRFPARKQHNRVWDYIPREAVCGVERYDTGEEDERRLLYVAITRAEKHLHCTWAPDPEINLYGKPSVFFTELTQDDYMLTREPASVIMARLTPTPRKALVNVQISFSDLRYLLECPRSFRLRCLYGFRPVINPRMGYGSSLHNALAELHQRSLAGEEFTSGEHEALVESLLGRHLHARYATPFLTNLLRRAVRRDLKRYLRDQAPRLKQLEHVEEVVEVVLPDGIVVSGRIDLIRGTDMSETIVVDFKTKDRAPAEQIPLQQLGVYVLGHEQRTGQRADLIEICNVSTGGAEREVVDDAMLARTVQQVQQAGERLRYDDLPRLATWCSTCAACDMAGICRSKPGNPTADVQEDTTF